MDRSFDGSSRNGRDSTKRKQSNNSKAQQQRKKKIERSKTRTCGAVRARNIKEKEMKRVERSLVVLWLLSQIHFSIWNVIALGCNQSHHKRKLLLCWQVSFFFSFLSNKILGIFQDTVGEYLLAKESK